MLLATTADEEGFGNVLLKDWRYKTAVISLHYTLHGVIDVGPERVHAGLSDALPHVVEIFLGHIDRRHSTAWLAASTFTNGNYRCLSIREETESGSTYMRVRFHKTRFDPRGNGELTENRGESLALQRGEDVNDVGDYLWSIDENEEPHPMCYFANLYAYFINFWEDMIGWSNSK